ncbi:UDP-3-O-acyl-N-acetylglucosamine deacetylase [Entomobacter blattae]|uniref:UDP-3-O-acyl-N-acetylglucosamine deacetylase n=1 Tax=Entomobacter blattae TaxID=2762277 RepID=A0A7H1NNS7_9PROT|nr:UDP-3-O-acyl-N-acetylglucosamine deacetylase [Entomobacter blattae]QNT77437.1 UDP-3-O-acyl-N-acetylglucosamine deacetylase [Entomobacter blattae]
MDSIATLATLDELGLSSSYTSQQRIKLAFPSPLSPLTFQAKTFSSSICCTGTGLHSGKKISLTLNPAPVGHGITFTRTDLRHSLKIPAIYSNVVETHFSTVIANPEQPTIKMATIEHIMAALGGLGITDAAIDVNGPEIPILDGSSSEFIFLMECAGITHQEAFLPYMEILKTVRVEDGDAYAEIRPNHCYKGLTLDFSIEFSAPAIGQQSFVLNLSADSFRNEVANCRTFVLRHEIEKLYDAGMALGGSLDNAIVVDDDKILNPTGLRHPNEFVRHKTMDAVGDLNLAGMPIHGYFTGHKSGHGLNNKLLRALFAKPDAWRIIPTATPRDKQKPSPVNALLTN